MSLPRPSHYEILGVQENADQVTIKKAFLRKASLWHPDRYLKQDWIALNDHDVCLEISKRINVAIGILSDDVKRSAYDFERRINSQEDDKFYKQWKELCERMEFYQQNKDMLDRFLTPLHQEKLKLKEKLKYSENDLEKEKRRNLVLEEEKNEAYKKTNQHQAAALKNFESLQAVYAKEINELDEKGNYSTATTSPFLFQPVPLKTAPTGKRVCQGLTEIRIGVDLREDHVSVDSVLLMFLDERYINDLSNYLKDQKLSHMYEVKRIGTMELSQDVCALKCTFSFSGASEAYFESVYSNNKYQAYILLREFEKLFDTSEISKCFWSEDAACILSEEELPRDLHPSVFYKQDQAAFCAKK